MSWRPTVPWKRKFYLIIPLVFVHGWIVLSLFSSSSCVVTWNRVRSCVSWSFCCRTKVCSFCPSSNNEWTWAKSWRSQYTCWWRHTCHVLLLLMFRSCVSWTTSTALVGCSWKVVWPARFPITNSSSQNWSSTERWRHCIRRKSPPSSRLSSFNKNTAANHNYVLTLSRSVPMHYSPVLVH